MLTGACRHRDVALVNYVDPVHCLVSPQGELHETSLSNSPECLSISIYHTFQSVFYLPFVLLNNKFNEKSVEMFFKKT